VHQLDVLARARACPCSSTCGRSSSCRAHAVDRALARLRRPASAWRSSARASARRALTLKDLVEEISGDLAGW
jgi:hypothetical protein